MASQTVLCSLEGEGERQQRLTSPHRYPAPSMYGERVAAALTALAEMIAGGDVMVLTGAGVSTDSGIPDYRGPTSRHVSPMTYQTFTSDAAARRRYWARSHVGWRRIACARPNLAHEIVARLERLGLTSGIVTQNVDGLHQAAGAVNVVDLHGRLDRVICLSCRVLLPRTTLDFRLRAANPGFGVDDAVANPDGDVEMSDDDVARFVVVDCPRCGGVLKPDVVFFGENVARPVVDRCFETLTCSRALLVLGSSLAVMSGYRFVRRAAKEGIPVAIVNRGQTRGDADAALKIDAPLAQALPELFADLPSTAGVPVVPAVSAARYA
jgi:NAD-dependent SIR2 family protein deacetylase